jgi:hypothetical protein
MNRCFLEDTTYLISNSVGRSTEAAQDVNRNSLAFSN